MTEYVEDEYEDESDLYDEIDELEDRLTEQEEVAEINSTIQAMERAHGSPFSNEEVQQIGELIDEGYTPESVYEAVAPSTPGEEAFNAQFGETVEHLSEQQGRPLAQSEIDKLYESSVYEGDPRYIEDGSVRDLSQKADRIAHVDERILEADPPEEVPEVIEPLYEDATKEERIAYMDARHSGAEVDTDTEYEGDE